MLNKTSYYSVISLLMASRMLLAQAEDSYSWLFDELSGIPDDYSGLYSRGAEFQSVEKHAKLLSILQKVKNQTGAPSEDDEGAAKIAMVLLAGSGSGDALQEIVAMLQVNSRKVRAYVPAVLLKLGSPEARQALEAASLQKMDLLMSEDFRDIDEVYNLARCTLLSVDPSERDALLQRLVQKMRTVLASQPTLIAPAEAEFYGIKARIGAP